MTGSNDLFLGAGIIGGIGLVLAGFVLTVGKKR